jgi:hypothetical protein
LTESVDDCDEELSKSSSAKEKSVKTAVGKEQSLKKGILLNDFKILKSI